MFDSVFVWRWLERRLKLSRCGLHIQVEVWNADKNTGHLFICRRLYKRGEAFKVWRGKCLLMTKFCNAKNVLVKFPTPLIAKYMHFWKYAQLPLSHSRRSVKDSQMAPLTKLEWCVVCKGKWKGFNLAAANWRWCTHCAYCNCTKATYDRRAKKN